MTEQDILNLIADDPLMMKVLTVAAEFNLPDWVIGAGFVRNKVWDYLHGQDNRCSDNDIDLVYFDKTKLINEKSVELRLIEEYPEFKWEVVNQATAHLWNEAEPYLSTFDALSKWTETATGIGVTLREGKLVLMAPCGIDDLNNLVVRPTNSFAQTEGGKEYIRDRVNKKRWLERWPKLQLYI